MARNQDLTEWIPPCDLCGGFRFDSFPASASRTARRCRDCGLVVFGGGDAGDDNGNLALPEAVVLENLRQHRSGNVLVLGPVDEAMRAEALRQGITLVVAPSPSMDPGARPPSFDSLRYAPESFDGIIATALLEWFESPALVFERSRLWLRPAGWLVVGSWDFRSLPARLRRRSWIHLRSSLGHHLMSLDAIRRYAARYGYYIGAVRTRSHSGDVASSMVGHPSHSWLATIATAPVAAAASILGMGPLVVVQMSKGGLSTRAVRRDAEVEAKSAPGLAPAMFVADP